MPRVCYFTGKKTSFGKKRAWAGQAIQKGGFGLKPTGISRRTFKPNLQKVDAMVPVTKADGSPAQDAHGRPLKVRKRILVSTNAMRRGLIEKPLKRRYGYTAQQKAQQH
ncbi:MAG: 50S ribosomal protein L28 [Phycisphaeraceae bacterium]|nr:50S ribosomal protein L28 [Phycisphaeraceae bacterium]MCW5753747.1 50S ribosomal protein L28 [Phycisphaeraceae bacterium]